MDLPPDFRDLLEELGRAGVDFALVGGYAVAYHGRVRATKDIDILLAAESENLARAAQALDAFGAPSHVIQSLRSMTDDEIVYFGQPPMRVDFLRRIDGVATADVLSRAESVTLDGVALRVISLRDLVANKRAAGRARDLEDAEFLERLEAHRRG